MSLTDGDELRHLVRTTLERNPRATSDDVMRAYRVRRGEAPTESEVDQVRAFFEAELAHLPQKPEWQWQRPPWVVAALTFAWFGSVVYPAIWLGLTWAEMRRELRESDMHPWWHGLASVVPIYGLVVFHQHFRRIEGLLTGAAIAVPAGWAVLGVIAGKALEGIDRAPENAFGSGLLNELLANSAVSAGLAFAGLACLAGVLASGQAALNAYWRALPGRPVSSRIHWAEWAGILLGVPLNIALLVPTVSSSILGPLGDRGGQPTASSFGPCASRGASAAAFHVTSGDIQVGDGVRPVGREARETVVIAEIQAAMEKSFTISPDNRRVAFVLKGGKTVVVDDRQQKTYDAVLSAPCFSPDSRRVAYVANVGGKVAVVVDGVEGKLYDGIGMPHGPIFSPDSKRVAYWAQLAGKWLLVLDGDEGKPYDGFVAGSLLFSPDSRRVAYAATVGGKYVAVVDADESKSYDQIGLRTPLFSPDGRRVAYFAWIGDRVVAVVDGTQSDSFVGLLDDSLSFSADGQHVGYAMKVPPLRGSSVNQSDPNKWVVVVDGRPGDRYDGVGPPIFSPDGHRVAHAARKGKVWMVVTDGQEGKAYAAIPDAPSFTTDGRVVHKAVVGRKITVVVDGIEGRQYDDVHSGPPTISTDGKRVAYAAALGKKWVAVIDGVESRPYDAVGGNPVFSPGGARTAFDAVLGKKWVVVADGAEWPERYDETIRGTPLFSPDGRRVISAVQTGNVSTIAIDGQPGRAYDNVLPAFGPAASFSDSASVLPGGGRIVFDAANRFHYLSIRGSSWYLVEEALD